MQGNGKARPKGAPPFKKSVYPAFDKISGYHPLREAVPGGYVDYRVRTRPGGQVFYFNFGLAREMGLIPRSHPSRLNPELCRVLLHAFSLQIINEYDILRKVPIPPRAIRPEPCMATRYLQIQHPSRKGETSGDGRGIWNGCFEGPGGVWDIASTGTGATRLSPATAIENRFFKTGDKQVSYGSGLADLLDGMSAAVMSEILHHNGVPTERVLAIISYGDGSSVNVRTGKNLLRPAHFFRLVKQNDYKALKGLADYHLKRQAANGAWPRLTGKKKYARMLERMARDIARTAAIYESDYIFCWMDWDGDNVLTDGGIIDYGSVRQFGLFHNEYRYDDVDKMSTTITEQKNKARYLVQTFAQIAGFLSTGRKKNIHAFARHPALRIFDREFRLKKDEKLAERMGFPPAVLKRFLKSRAAMARLREFERIYVCFERAKARRGKYKVTDGITWDAIYCMRDIMRELPRHFLGSDDPMDARDFMDTIKSNYASARDASLTPRRKRLIRRFQKEWLAVTAAALKLSGLRRQKLLEEMAARSAVINRYERITGDAVIRVASRLIGIRKDLDSQTFQRLFQVFVAKQILKPDFPVSKLEARETSLSAEKPRRILNGLTRLVREHREGL